VGRRSYRWDRHCLRPRNETTVPSVKDEWGSTVSRPLPRYCTEEGQSAGCRRRERDLHDHPAADRRDIVLCVGRNRPRSDSTFGGTSVLRLHGGRVWGLQNAPRLGSSRLRTILSGHVVRGREAGGILSLMPGEGPERSHHSVDRREQISESSYTVRPAPATSTAWEGNA
jgi:hypothetical protein